MCLWLETLLSRETLAATVNRQAWVALAAQYSHSGWHTQEEIPDCSCNLMWLRHSVSVEGLKDRGKQSCWLVTAVPHDGWSKASWWMKIPCNSNSTIRRAIHLIRFSKLYALDLGSHWCNSFWVYTLFRGEKKSYFKLGLSAKSLLEVG